MMPTINKIMTLHNSIKKKLGSLIKQDSNINFEHLMDNKNKNTMKSSNSQFLVF